MRLLIASQQARTSGAEMAGQQFHLAWRHDQGDALAERSPRSVSRPPASPQSPQREGISGQARFTPEQSRRYPESFLACPAPCSRSAPGHEALPRNSGTQANMPIRVMPNSVRLERNLPGFARQDGGLPRPRCFPVRQGRAAAACGQRQSPVPTWQIRH